jgi:hypothetical protein
MEEPQTENAERTEAQLVEQVKNQVEYYFSKENLLVDPFLTSQMDAQMCVPISIVMKVRHSSVAWLPCILLLTFFCYSSLHSSPSSRRSPTTSQSCAARWWIPLR